MFSNDLVAICLFILALFVTPGPATLSLAASGAAYGLRKSIPYFMGIYTGLLTTLILVMFGLAFIFLDYPVVFTAFKYISLIYILFLSYKLAQSRPKALAANDALSYSKGFILNMINPKAYIAHLAIISQFAKADESYYATVFTIFILIAIIVPLTNILWILVGEQIAKLFESEKAVKFVQYSFAILLSFSVIYASFFMN